MDDLLSKSTPEIMQIAQEYGRLAAIRNPSEAEADRLGEILEMASQDCLLSFWIEEADHLLGHDLGLLDEHDRESYQDQQALLREHQGNSLSPRPSHRSSVFAQRRSP